MTTKINKEILIEGLEELADRTLQEQLWIHGSPENMSSFTEAVCGVFDDSGLSRALESEALGEELSPLGQSLVRALSQAIEQVREDRSPSATIDDPGMEEVRRIATQLLAHLRET